MKKNHKISIVFVFAVLLTMGGAALTSAQMQETPWSEPYRLSTEGSSASPSVMLTDQYGNVHTFWIESSQFDTRSIIQYARFDGETWTNPLDIFVSAANVRIEQLAATIDQNNELHLIWTSGGYRNSPIYYSRAPAHGDLSAKQWQTPTRIDVPAYLVQIEVDSEDVVHISYAKFFEPEAGVYYLRSPDHGESWSTPILLDPDILPGYGPAWLKMTKDQDDGLHLVWYYDRVDVVESDWIRYAHSLDGGEEWSEPFTIAQNESMENVTIRAPGPLLTVQGEMVHVIWAAGELNYRNYRFSTDLGRTWSTTERIFGNLNGQAWDDLAIDGAGRIHFLGQIRFPQGIWHAFWDQSRWSEPSLVYLMRSNSEDLLGDRFNVHRIRLVARTGNQLVATFHDRAHETQTTSDLYAMHRPLDDVQPIPPIPTPTPTPSPTPAPEPSVTPTAILSEPTAIVPTVTVQSSFEDTGTSPTAAVDSNSSVTGLLWGIIPALLLVAGTTVFHLILRR